MTAQQHGSLSAYNRHYRHGTKVCAECRAAATAYAQQARETASHARHIDPRETVPVGWPCPDCVWSIKIRLLDGRLFKWRLQCCEKHRRAW